MKKIVIVAAVLALFIVAVYGILISKNSKSRQVLQKSSMKLTSSAFSNNSKIPAKYTCDGKNINPPLEISEVPQNAKSLVLLVDDPDSPIETFDQWVLYNISPS